MSAGWQVDWQSCKQLLAQAGSEEPVQRLAQVAWQALAQLEPAAASPAVWQLPGALGATGGISIGKDG